MTARLIMSVGDLSLPRRLRLRGTVVAGSGEGAKFVGLPWVKKQIAEKLGFNPYLGTLNIKLSEESVKIKKLLEKTKSIEISSIENFCRGKCYRASLKRHVKCAIVIPDVPNYPEDVLEIVAPVNLREKLQLKDGDHVKIEVEPP